VLSTNITPDLRTKLEEEKRKTGHSLSQIIEHRLRATFAEDARIEDQFGSRQNYAIMRIAAMALELDEKAADGNWLSDPVLFDRALRTVVATLEALRPSGPVGADRQSEIGGTFNMEATVAEAMADVTAAALWAHVQSIDPALPIKGSTAEDYRIKRLKDRLGAIADRPVWPSDDEWKRRLMDTLIKNYNPPTDTSDEGKQDDEG
jgi:hypothetical protein